MLRKSLLIFILAGVLASLLYLKPWRIEKEQVARIIDRLPSAPIIGQSNLLKLSDEFSQMSFFYELPFRDLITPNIILRQCKKYGVDVQSPLYFFASDSLSLNSEWGIMASLQDIEEAPLGVLQLKKIVEITDTVIAEKTVFYSAEFDLYLTYGSDWALLYHGKNMNTVLQKLLGSTLNSIEPRWRSFLEKSKGKDTDVVAEIDSKYLQEFGVQSAFITLTNDSTSLVFKTELNHSDVLAFQLKDNGLSYEAKEFTSQLINLHFDVSQLRQNKKHPYRAFLNKLGTKISFPTNELLDCWDGDLAFRRGGIQTIHETYFSSELDDDFNIREVEKSKEVQITGFALQLSTNSKGKDFIAKLKQKGILSKRNKKYRLLYSPPVKLKTNDSTLVFYTSKYRPNLITQTESKAIWTFDYTPVEFQIDSTTTKVVYGRITVPLKKILRDVLK